MFGGNDQPPPPPSAPLQTVNSGPLPEQQNLAKPGADTQKVAGQLEANTAKPGALATPATPGGDTETNKSLLGT